MNQTELDDFWVRYAECVKELEGVRTVEDVIAICHNHFGASSGDAFFPGGSGDVEMLSVLLDNGWRPVWIEAAYYFAIREPYIDCGLTYVEGDIYFGIQKPLH